MAASNRINITANLDTSKVTRGISQMKTQIGGVAKSASMAAVGLGAIAAGAGAVTVKVFGMTAQLEAVQQKAQIVFGDQLGLVKTWAQESGAAMGLSATEATTLATNMGDLLIPMQFTREEAAKMSTNVIGLSGALSEWIGGTKSAAEVSSILAKAMLGEREQLKTLGISIMEKDVVQRVASMGMKEATGAAMQQARAMATQELIFEKSKDAQKKYAEGAGSLIRVQGELKAQLATVKNEVLIALIQSMQQLAEYVSSTLMPKLREFIPILREKIPEAIEKAKQVFNESKPFLMTFVEGLKTIKDAALALYNFWVERGDTMKIIIAGIGLAIVVAFGPVSGTFLAINGLILLIGYLSTRWREITNSILGFLEHMANGYLHYINLIVQNIHEKLINGVIGLINKMIGLAQPLLNKLGLDLEKIGMVDIPDLMIKIPRLNTAAEAAHEKLVSVDAELMNMNEAAAAAAESVTAASNAIATGADTIATGAGNAVDRMKKINAAFSTSWADNELALLEATEAAFDQGHTNNWLADKINKSTEAEKKRAEVVTESTAAIVSANQKMMMEGNRALAMAGVTNAFFDSSGNLKMLEEPVAAAAAALDPSKHNMMSFGSIGAADQFGGGQSFSKLVKGVITAADIQKYEKAQGLESGTIIEVSIDGTGFIISDEEKMGRAVASAINAAALKQGAIITSDALGAAAV